VSGIDPVLRANRTIMAVPVYQMSDGTLVIVSPTGTTCPLSAPTAAILDAWRQVLTTTATGGAHGGNVSCAILDDASLGLDPSETDSELTICSIGNESTPTFAKINAQLTGLRDKNAADTGIFNLWTQLMCGVDIQYGFVDRIGSKSTDAFVVGDTVSIFVATTDEPVDQKGDRANLKLQQNPLPTGDFLNLYTLAA
jgi:hypothetical protein